ncbi:MAG TPA: hypothetical protein PKO23_03095 [Candidatus Hydrogenedentes bacterium]|jgi:hypothetical protein|nr:hypothetical protein [Candidatus Hydrogenedentota bacterium]
MSEKEIRLIPSNDPGSDDGVPTGPNVDRLLELRHQAEVFNRIAERASSFALHSGLSAFDLLDSIHNTSGQ